MKLGKHKNFIPHFIAEKYLSGEENGNFRAFVVYADITNITKLIDHMIEEGKAGALVLSQEMEALFEEMNKVVYSHGGFVGDYHGDAFAAYFPIVKDQATTWERARGAAEGLLTFFAKKGNRHTKLGNYALNVKIGIGFGMVEWGIVGEHNSLGWYFRGAALAQAVQAESMAEIGRLYLTGELQALGPARNYPEEGINLDKISIPTQLLSYFYPSEIFNQEWAEIKNIIALSIRFVGALGHDKLNALFALACRFGIRYGGYVNNIEFHGKPRNLLVVFGYPYENGDILRRALSFILNFRTSLERSTLPVRLKAAIAGGDAYCGYRGGEIRKEPVCIGPAIGFADLLLKVAPTDEIILSEDLANAVNQFARVSLVAKKNFRGVKSTVAYFKLDSLVSLNDGIAFPYKLRGRSNELQSLRKELRVNLSTRQLGNIILIKGEPGIGKSHLVYALRQTLEQERIPHHWVYLNDDPLFPLRLGGLRKYLYRFFRLNRANRSAENKAYFLQACNELLSARTMPVKLKQGLQQHISFISEQIGLEWSSSLAAATTQPDKYKELLFKTLKAFFVALAFKIPVIIHIENAHAIDDETKEFLSYLLQGMQNVPLHIIATARGDFPPDWFLMLSNDYVCKEMMLKEPEEKYTESIMLAELSSPVSEDLDKYLKETSGLNPMKLKTLLQTLKGLEIIEYNQSIEAWDTIKGKALPNSLEDCLDMQLEAIPKKFLTLIKQAAVIGNWFPIYYLARLRGEEEISKELMLQCERYGFFVFEQIMPTDLETYVVFNSPLVREYILSKVGKSKIEEIRASIRNLF